MSIQCCKGCLPPKRTPYCKFDGTCNKYQEAKALHDAENAQIDKAKSIYSGLYQQTGDHVAKANKRKGKK